MANDLIIIDGKPLTAPPPQHEGFATLLKAAGRLVDYVPAGADRRQLIAAVLAEANQKSLAGCARESVAKTAFNCIVLGLVPGAMMGMAHFVPFKNQCQLVVGYKGWLELAYDSDFLIDVHSEVVLNGEEFSRWNDEGGPHIRHTLALDRDERLIWPNVEAAYCVWHSRGGGRGLELVGRKALEVLKKRGNVWDSNPIAMALKTPILRASKTWKRTRRIAMASALDDAIDAETSQPSLVDAPLDMEPEKPRLEDFATSGQPEQPSPSDPCAESDILNEYLAEMDQKETIADATKWRDQADGDEILSPASMAKVQARYEMRVANIRGKRGQKGQLFDAGSSATEAGQ